jgi:hypothetical protein
MTMDSISSSIRSMGKGSLAILVILLVLLAGTLFVSYLGWASAAGTDVPASGYLALALGVVFSLVVGFGLMGLVFYSSRQGYDEPARLVKDDDASPDPQP